MKQLFTISMLFFMSFSSSSQSWVDTQMYPFQSRYFSLPQDKMHYIDEGKGEVILFIHGTPTWSFLYRDFIKEFSKTHRCIAIDHLGFGLSDKPNSLDGTPQSHSENLSRFIKHLDLKNITLVIHDFGGPIGLGAALQNPQRIKQVVMFNTWLWETESNPQAQKVDKVLNSRVGRWMYLRLNFSPRVLLKQGFTNKKNLTKAIHQQYLKPFPSKESRYGLYRIGLALLGSSGWYEEQWNQLHQLEDIPWVIIWGMEDKFITPKYLDKWTTQLPNALVYRLNTGHFVQEESTEQAIDIMKETIHATP